MSNALQDAIIGNIAASMNGDVQNTRTAIAQYVKEKDLELIERKASTVELIEQKLKQAQDRDAAPSVIGAYEKLLGLAAS